MRQCNSKGNDMTDSNGKCKGNDDCDDVGNALGRAWAGGFQPMSKPHNLGACISKLNGVGKGIQQVKATESKHRANILTLGDERIHI